MRRKISIICVLLLALCMSGWSSALAAALSCSHAKGEGPRAMAQNHACCHAKTARAQSHCSTPQHEAMADMQMMPVADVDAEVVAQLIEACAHCMDRSEVPAMPTVYQVNQIKRGQDAATLHMATPLMPHAALFTPLILSRQGSPPGARPRKHLLISVFII